MPTFDWLPLLTDLADLADRISTGYFRSSDLPVEHKPDRSLVTKADLEVESAVRDELARRHPELGVFGEEHGEHEGRSGARLIVDPIDATANFARGLPIYATLLAIEDEGEVVAGLVSAPALHQRWHAARGQGAYAGTRRLQVSRVGAIEDAQIFHGSLAGAEAAPGTERIPGLLARSWRQRGLGDFYQHVLVAEGCGEIAIDVVVKPWDIAPLQVIVEEAGGKATALDGSRSIYAGSLVTGNPAMHAVALAGLA
ncbi:MAG: inositol monophosphatase family protein [Nannocystaceae bacterium]